jgi:hypothetical protein
MLFVQPRYGRSKKTSILHATIARLETDTDKVTRAQPTRRAKTLVADIHPSMHAMRGLLARVENLAVGANLL